MKRALISFEGESIWGVERGGVIELENGASLKESEAQFLPPINPSKIIATHLSYRSRCVEYKMKKLPAAPSYFVKPNNSISYHRAPVARPRGCKYLNYEGEIAVVIGRRCLGATEKNALGFVAGYTIVNDWGVHDFRHADRGSMLRVKGQDGFCPAGPYIVDAADLDPTNLHIRTTVNGRIVQDDNTSGMLFPFAYQIADLSRLLTLEPGDVILTGTPANSRPVEIGDVVAVAVDGIGTLENTVVELDRDLEPIGDLPQVTAATLHVALTIPEDEAERLVNQQ